MDIRDLPTLYTGLNAVTTVLLIQGYRFIRAKREDAHKRTMLAATLCSALFLVLYLIYHSQVMSVP